MVSTRSQSRLSNSSLDAGGGDDAGAEVTSATPARRGRAARAHEPVARPPALEAIIEEGAGAAPRTARAPRTTRRAAAAAAAEPEQGGDAGGGAAALAADPALLDRLAREMFAALGAAFGARGEPGADSQGAGGSEQGGGDAGGGGGGAAAGAAAPPPPRVPRWLPDVALPAAVRAAPRLAADGSVAPPPGGAPPPPLSKLAAVPAPDGRAARAAARAARPDTAGAAWFHLPAARLTDEAKRDLRLLRLRGALDPKAFYKRPDATAFPRHFQVGTVVEGAAEFYSARLTRRERAPTFADEVLRDPALAATRRRRFAALQQERGRWGAAKAAGKDSKGRRTDNARTVKKPRRPKH